MKRKINKKCIGVGRFKGKCQNEAGLHWNKNSIYCPRCEDERRRMIENSFKKFDEGE